MEFRGKYWFLSNFYPVDMEDKTGLKFLCAESAYQSCKTREVTLRGVFQFLNGKGARNYGRLMKLPPNWNSVRCKIMYKILLQKFSKPDLAKKLLETGDTPLIHNNNHRDVFWGVYMGRGKNILGKMLMKIRKDLMINAQKIPQESV